MNIPASASWPASSASLHHDIASRAADLGVRAGADVLLDESVTPDLADADRRLRAGQVLEWMDVIGALAATRHCRRPVVTASVDGMAITRPILVGMRVTMSAAVAYTTARSIGVSVILSADGNRVGDGYMTFVALGDDGVVVAVPQLQPETPIEHERWREGLLRREFRVRSRERGRPADRPLVNPFQKLLRWPAVLLGARPINQDARRRSLIHKIEPVFAGALNFHGTLYGGALMRWLETSAGLSARAYLGGVAVEFSDVLGLEFERPVRAHTFVHIRARVVHVGDGITVSAEVDTEEPISGEQSRAVRGYLRFRRLDGRTRGVPALVHLTGAEREHLAAVEERLVSEQQLARR